MLRKIFFRKNRYFSVILSILIFGSLNLLSREDSCKRKIDNLSETYKLLCKFSFLVSKPSEYFIEGARQSKSFLKFKKLSGLIVQDTEKTIKRFNNLNLKNGFTFYYPKNSRPDAGYLILSAANSKSNGFPLVELWDLNAQKKIHTYDFNYKEIFKKYNIDKKKFRLIHPLILNDGSLIVNTLTGIKNTVFKFDKCGKLIKSIDKFRTHHSLEIDEDGNIYSPTYLKRKDINKNAILHPVNFLHDGFIIFDKTLKVKESFSLLDIYEANNLYSDIYGNQRLINDPFHLNDVQPLKSSKGKKYVLLSLKGHSRLMLLRLEDLKVIWLIDRATLLQHDVDVIGFKEDFINISVFDNNTRTFDNGSNVLKNFDNRIVYFQNLPLETKTPYISISDEKSFEKHNINYQEFNFLNPGLVPKTKTEGLSDHILENNSVMIEESNYGRLIEIDKIKKEILWQYYNNEKNSQPYMMSWSRRLNKLPNRLNLSTFQECKI